MHIVPPTRLLAFQLGRARKIEIAAKSVGFARLDVSAGLLVHPARCQAEIHQLQIRESEDVALRISTLFRDSLVIIQQYIMQLQIVVHVATFMDHFQDINNFQADPEYAGIRQLHIILPKNRIK